MDDQRVPLFEETSISAINLGRETSETMEDPMNTGFKITLGVNHGFRVKAFPMAKPLKSHPPRPAVDFCCPTAASCTDLLQLPDAVTLAPWP